MANKKFLDNWFCFDKEPLLIGSAGPPITRVKSLKTIDVYYSMMREKHTLHNNDANKNNSNNNNNENENKDVKSPLIINLQMECDLSEFCKDRENVCWIPIKNYGAPTLEQIKLFVETVEKAIEKEKRQVIVHCAGGRGRTGVMIVAYLIYKKYFETVENAIEDIRSARKGAVESKAQERALEKYFISLQTLEEE